MEDKQLFKNKMAWLIGSISPRLGAQIRFKRVFGRRLNLKNPQDYNEKIQWLKFYSETSEWTRLADKYLVRQYIKDCELENMLVPLYGIYNKAEEIDFSNLPHSFIIKTNHGCGHNLIVRDKDKLNVEKTIKVFNECLKKKYGITTSENHYTKIPPKIVIEKLLKNDSGFSSSIVDYKFHCIRGEAKFVEIRYNRKGTHSKYCLYDMDWHRCDEYMPVNKKMELEIPKPKTLDAMVQACRLLGNRFPVVRIDFYESEGNTYFGEMTFTPAGGFDTDFTAEFYQLLGSYIDLQKK